MAYTFNDLVIRASEYLQDATNARWAATVVGRYINDGQRDFARGSKILKKQSVALSASTAYPTPTGAFYVLPADFFELESVWNNVQHLEATTTNCLPWNWNVETGTPTRYILGDFGPADVRLYPYPVGGTTGLVIYYTYLPADIASSSTSPIPAQYHLALAYYATAQCYLADGQYRDAAKGQEMMQMYQRELADATGRAGRRQSSDTVSVPYRHV